MKKLGLVSKYTVAQFKPQKTNCNEDPIKNKLNRKLIIKSYMQLLSAI